MVFIRAHGGGGRVLTPMFKKINFGHAASLVDDRRHEAEINFSRAALRPGGLIDMLPF